MTSSIFACSFGAQKFWISLTSLCVIGKPLWRWLPLGICSHFYLHKSLLSWQKLTFDKQGAKSTQHIHTYIHTYTQTRCFFDGKMWRAASDFLATAIPYTGCMLTLWNGSFQSNNEIQFSLQDCLSGFCAEFHWEFRIFQASKQL